jgi:riboflavin kinase/FMN adenylyltransferase
MTFFNIHLLDIVTGEEIALPHSPDSQVGFALALGNFDGVHAAHRELINVTIDAAEKLCKSGKLIHPAAFFFRVPSGDFISTAQSEHLTTLEEKLCLFRSCGLRYAFIADFPSLRNCDADAFMREVLKDMCAAHAVCCGYNFRFGKNAAWTAADLCHFAKQNGVKCSVVHEKTVDGKTISSTEIRRLIEMGQVDSAARLLGKAYSITAEIEHGVKIGRKMGIRTINQHIPEGKVVPENGVYCCTVTFDVDGKSVTYGGICNIGSRPTVNDNADDVTVETHIFDFDGDIYGSSVTTKLYKKLRNERKFDNIDALRQQIESDVMAAKLLLKEILK